MMRATRLSLAVLSLLVPQDSGVWPPADSLRPGNGVILPQLLRQVSPHYASEAMRQKIEGKALVECIVEIDGSVQRARIVKSLDGVFGLDEEALNAARQWRFKPGTKDGVAVPVVITIELTFALRAAPRPETWPSAFTTPVERAIDTFAWAEDVSDVSGLQIRVSFPASWMLQKGGSVGRLVSFQSAGGRGPLVFFIDNPKPSRVQVGSGVTTDMLQRLADASRQQMTTAAGNAEVKGIGQARVADRFWIWYDLALAKPDPATLPLAASAFAESIDGSRLWTFVTTEGAQQIAAGCVALFPRNSSDADKERELQEAGAEFAAMLKHVSIKVL